jgi:hypothetical protein
MIVVSQIHGLQSKSQHHRYTDVKQVQVRSVPYLHRDRGLKAVRVLQLRQGLLEHKVLSNAPEIVVIVA